MPIPARAEDWQAPNEAEGIEPFVSNLLQIFERDQVPALLWAARGGTLSEFVVFNNTRRINQRWPALSVIARQESPPVDASGLVQVKNTADVEIEVKGSEPNELAWELMRRVRAVRAMIGAASVGDLTADMESNFGAINIEVTPATYTSFIDKSKTIYTQYATMTVTQELLEG